MVAHGFSQSGLENLQGWRRHSFAGQPAPLPDFSRAKNFSFCPLWTFSYFNICLLCVVLLPFTTVKSLAPFPWQSPCKYWKAAIRHPATVSSTGWTSPAPSPAPLLNSLRFVNVFPVLGSPKWYALRSQSLYKVTATHSPAGCRWGGGGRRGLPFQALLSLRFISAEHTSHQAQFFLIPRSCYRPFTCLSARLCSFLAQCFPAPHCDTSLLFDGGFERFWWQGTSGTL